MLRNNEILPGDGSNPRLSEAVVLWKLENVHFFGVVVVSPTTRDATFVRHAEQTRVIHEADKRLKRAGSTVPTKFERRRMRNQRFGAVPRDTSQSPAPLRGALCFHVAAEWRACFNVVARMASLLRHCDVTTRERSGLSL